MNQLTWRQMTTSSAGWWSGIAAGVEISCEPRPSYCDRGRWVVNVHPDKSRAGVKLRMSLDGADAFPRYYFDFERMKLEMQDWVNARGELKSPTPLLSVSDGGQSSRPSSA